MWELIEARKKVKKKILHYEVPSAEKDALSEKHTKKDEKVKQRKNSVKRDKIDFVEQVSRESEDANRRERTRKSLFQITKKLCKKSSLASAERGRSTSERRLEARQIG
mgnify:CR=1 FL=1